MTDSHGRQVGSWRQGTRLVVRGKVLCHEAVSTGWWIFKQHFDVIAVELDGEELARARKLTGSIQLLTPEGGEAQIPSMIRVTTPRWERKVDEFPIGALVDVTFASHGLVAQFFDGRVPLQLVGLQRGGESKAAA